MELIIEFQGKNYTIEEFISQKRSSLPAWALSSYNFLRSWVSGDKTFIQSTSGSTGAPKMISISRTQMEISARNTISALEIPTKAKALHCIDAAYIGGKMMWVRAILGDWHVHLIEPTARLTSNLLKGDYHFAAMVPMQVTGTLDHNRGAAILNRFKKIIIGGAAVSHQLINSLEDLSCLFYSTFGMTETISHIALKQLNGKQASEVFNVIGDNEVAQNEKGCLKIKGGVTNGQWLETNDIVELTNKGFIWIGRADLVVNSGGIKIAIEQAEDWLKSLLAETNIEFFFWKEADPQLGEKLIGATSSETLFSSIQTKYEDLKSELPRYHLPKTWYLLEEFQYTASGKLDRINSMLRSKSSITF